jgi:hypothetical protein
VQVPKYAGFDDLPKWLQKRIAEVFPSDPRGFVRHPVPALQGKSILEVMNTSEGLAEVRAFVNRVELKFR